MADLLHDFLAEINTQQYSQVVCGHDQPDDLAVITLEPHVDTQENARPK